MTSQPNVVPPQDENNINAGLHFGKFVKPLEQKDESYSHSAPRAVYDQKVSLCLAYVPCGVDV